MEKIVMQRNGWPWCWCKGFYLSAWKIALHFLSQNYFERWNPVRYLVTRAIKNIMPMQYLNPVKTCICSIWRWYGKWVLYWIKYWLWNIYNIFVKKTTFLSQIAKRLYYNNMQHYIPMSMWESKKMSRGNRYVSE